MNILFFIIPIALILGLFFVVSFIVATKKGQFDDLDSPAIRILNDDQPIPKNNKNNNQRRM